MVDLMRAAATAAWLDALASPHDRRGSRGHRRDSRRAGTPRPGRAHDRGGVREAEDAPSAFTLSPVVAALHDGPSGVRLDHSTDIAYADVRQARTGSAHEETIKVGFASSG